MIKAILLVTMILALFVAVFTHPIHEDQEEAATGDDHHGRVQIKVYRGPSEHEHFAPWGYWVKQPADHGHY